MYILRFNKFFVFVFQSYFEKYDHDQDGKIDYHDFLNYYVEHEKELRLKFDKIDRNRDGKYMDNSFY